jgi:hypothetical protein
LIDCLLCGRREAVCDLTPEEAINAAAQYVVDRMTDRETVAYAAEKASALLERFAGA